MFLSEVTIVYILLKIRRNLGISSRSTIYYLDNNGSNFFRLSVCISGRGRILCNSRFVTETWLHKNDWSQCFSFAISVSTLMIEKYKMMAGSLSLILEFFGDRLIFFRRSRMFSNLLLAILNLQNWTLLFRFFYGNSSSEIHDLTHIIQIIWKLISLVFLVQLIYGMAYTNSGIFTKL